MVNFENIQPSRGFTFILYVCNPDLPVDSNVDYFWKFSKFFRKDFNFSGQFTVVNVSQKSNFRGSYSILDTETSTGGII